MKPLKLALTAALLAVSTIAHAQAPQPIRVAIVGLVHGHVKGLLSTLPKNDNTALVAIVESQQALAADELNTAGYTVNARSAAAYVATSS